MGITGVGKTVHAVLFTAGGREGEGARKEPGRRAANFEDHRLCSKVLYTMNYREREGGREGGRERERFRRKVGAI